MMKRGSFLYILLCGAQLLSCTGHKHGSESAMETDTLSVQLYDARYKDIALTEEIALKLDSLSAVKTEPQMVALNAMAYAALMDMDYSAAVSLYRRVLAESVCDIEKLVADVGLMTVYYRVSANKHFFDCRASAVERIKRIAEDVGYLSQSDKARFERAKIEFAIVSICYFSNLSMLDDMQGAMELLRNTIERSDDPALKVYANMMLANSNALPDERLRLLARGLDMAEKRGYTWLAANYKLLLAITLRDNGTLNGGLPESLSRMLPENSDASMLPYILATGASDDFRHYGDKYMMMEALAVSASCRTQIDDYEGALELLESALNEINGYYGRYYPEYPDFSSNILEQYDMEIEPYMGSDEGMYNIPECLLSVRREASCAYAGLGNKIASDINRESYLLLLRTTRLNKQLESSASNAQAGISRLDYWLRLSMLAIALLLGCIIIFNYRRRKYVKSYSNELKCLPDICRQLFSSLPQEIAGKEELLVHMSSLLNSSLKDFSGEVEFSFTPFGDAGVNSYSFELSNIGGVASETLYLRASQPLTSGKLLLLKMLLPYLSVAIAEGMRLADISDEQERLEEMRQASEVYLVEHKRENLLKRVSMSVAISMRPFIDRIINELRALPDADSTDAERKLGYVAELTEKLDDLNVILERWIKMRKGEMNLQVESFSLSGLFSIIEKSRTLLETRGISLSVDDGASVVKADKALTLFMINTLVDNASKFTPQGGTIALECVEGENYVEVAVTDSGIGISQSDIDRILNEKVYDASTIGCDNGNLQAKSKGYGFGLMNCKGIIEKYRKTDAIFSVCSMDIKSNIGGGSRFSFRLPKGVLRCIMLLFMLLPCSASAQDGLFDNVRYYADSVYSSNTHGNHDEAFIQARKAIDLLNSYYVAEIGGNDTLALVGNGYAELNWWRDGLFDSSLTEDIFYNILDIRNELAVASLAQQKWQQYRYNNYIYSTLYRLVDEDKDIAAQYENARDTLSLRQALIGLSCFLLLFLLLYLLLSYLRHSVIGKANEHLVQDTNLKLLEFVASSSNSTPQQLLQGIADEIYAGLGERMRMKRVGLLLSDENMEQRAAAAAPVPFAGGRADVYLYGVADGGTPYLSSDALLRVLPLYATVAGKEVLVGAMEFVTERPLSENETVSVELVARFVASMAYHRTVRVANSYTTLEEVEEETERIRLEENRLHVQNMVMDNSLSVIKHETVYYPSRVRELAQKALAGKDGRGEDIAVMNELMDYYNSVFGILANCAKRELDTMCFNLSSQPIDVFFAEAQRYVARCAAKRGVDIPLVYEPSGAVVNVDAGLVAYLFEALIDAAFKIERSGVLHFRATDAGDTVKVELADNRRTLSSDEVAELFAPSRFNIGPRNGLLGMEYLIAKEIIRMHEDYTGRHGLRMEASSDVEGTVILFTLPK